MKKHPSGFIITDPAGLEAFQHPVDTNTLPLELTAVVALTKVRIVPPTTSATQFEYERINITDFWAIVTLFRAPGSSIYFVRDKITDPATDMYKTKLTGCWFPREILPLAFIKSPARIALERLGATLS